jgi:hypothetical protein
MMFGVENDFGQWSEPVVPQGKGHKLKLVIFAV